MPEKLLRIEGPDNNGIYGRLRSSGSRKLVIHAHGMTHTMHGLLEVTSSEFFATYGFDHYRVGFYDYPKDSRRLINSTATTHIKDLKSITDHFSSQYDSIYITAHSLGALATLILNPSNIKAISLWDPSTDVSFFWKRLGLLHQTPDPNFFRLHYECDFFISKEMVDDMAMYDDAYCLKAAQKITTPTQFVIPEESIFMFSPHASPEAYAKAVKGPSDLFRLSGANHTFSNDGDRQRLFAATLRWFQAHP